MINCGNKEESYDNLREIIDQVFIKEFIDKILDTLLEREKKVIIYRFYDELSLDQTGKKLGVSRERIRQIEHKAIRKLRSSSLHDEYRKLGLNYVNKYATYVKQKEQTERERQNEIVNFWKEKYQEKLQSDQIENERIQKLQKEKTQVVYIRRFLTIHDIPLREEIIVREIPKPSEKPPDYVILAGTTENPFLQLKQYFNGDIRRDRDPETYDRWLNYLLNK